MNKIKFGLKNVHYAPVTFASDGTPTFDTPVHIPGAVNLTMAKKNENLVFYADNGVYVELGDNSAVDGDLEIAMIPEGFRTGPLGETLDAKGLLVEKAEQTLGHFAFMFEFEGDVNAVRHVYYNCTASQDETAGETKGEGIQVQTEKLKLHARPLPKTKEVHVKTGDTTDATTYASWYTAVQMPTPVSNESSGSSGSSGSGSSGSGNSGTGN